MSEVLLLRLLIAFVSGWLVVGAVTTVADIHGAGRAGFVGGLPSTGPVGLLLIGWSQSQAAAVQATSIFPLAFCVTFAFLLFYSLPVHRAFGRRITIALLLWLMLSVLVASSHFDDFFISITASMVLSLIILVAHRRIGIGDVIDRKSVV